MLISPIGSLRNSYACLDDLCTKVHELVGDESSRDTYENMNYVNHCLPWFSMSRSCFSRQVFYGSRRLAGGQSYCQRSEASQTM